MKNIVFIIGAPRSGTTLLGKDILSGFRGINYVGEKNWIWKYGNAYKKHEELNALDISEAKKKYIINRFDKLFDKNKINIEKTPSNCLRVDYINEIFPDAKFIHIIRNGYAASISTMKEWSNTGQNALDSIEVRKSSIVKRIFLTISKESEFRYRKFNLIELYELPVYFKRLWLFLVRNIFSHPTIWGPRIPDLENYFKNNTLKKTTALQWAYCVDKATNSLGNYDKKKVHRLIYEDLIHDPLNTIKDVINFLDIEPSNEELLKCSRKIATSRLIVKKDDEIKAIIEPIQKKIFNETNHPRP